MTATIGIFGIDDGFAYRARRTRAGEFYESKRAETRSEATYEAIGSDVGRRFETESANGVTTFDADSCEALDFVSMETWREDKARFEAISAMKTFGMHRLWKSFVIMGKHARVRKFRRMRRIAAQASAFFGASTSAGAVSGALDVREATAAIENEVKIFCRGEREADRDDLSVSASTYDLDLEGDARTIAETYDADSLRAALEKQTEDNQQALRDASAHVLNAILRAKDAVEVQFQERFDESLRPMMEATKKYKLIRSARSSATKANGGGAQTLRSLFPHTERALMSKVSRKMESFERVAWMMFKASVINARAESLRKIHALLTDDSGSNDRSPPLFSVSFEFESSTLAPAPATFVESFRSAANKWSASAIGESMHTDAPRDVFVVDDGDFDSQVSDVLRILESIFDTALDVVNAVLSPLRAEAQSLANALSADADVVDSAEDESILGEFTHLAKRASLFKKECNKLASIRNGCVEVSVQTAKRALNPIVSAPLERASERSLARVAEASQNLATKITKTRMECEDTGAPIPPKTIESIRKDAARIDRVHADLEECGVRVPEMQTASFDALKSEIDALENERREDDDDDDDDSARV